MANEYDLKIVGGDPVFLPDDEPEFLSGLGAHRELRTGGSRDSLPEGEVSTSPTEYGNGAAQWAS